MIADSIRNSETEDDLASMSDAELLAYKGKMCQDFYGIGLTYESWSPERGEWWVRSLSLFVETFLDMELETPEFHRNWYEWRTSEKSYMNLAPRDHAKTTVHAVNSTVWEICMDRNLRFMHVFSTTDVGKIVLTQIKNHLERNEKIVDVFGFFNPAQISPDERSVGLDWSQTSITVNRDNRNLKDPTIVVLGAGSNVLSRRCDRLLSDDLITDQIAHSEADSERTIRWYFNDVYPCLVSTGQEIISGTLYRLGDFYHKIMEQGKDKGGAYQVYIGDAIVDERRQLTLWPERWSWEGLMYQKAKLGIIRFNRNYRNIVMADGDSNFPMIWFTGGEDDRGIVYRGCYNDEMVLSASPRALNLKISAIGVDPSLAVKNTATGKYFALVVLGIDTMGRLVICDIVREFCNSITQRRYILNYYLKWEPRYIAVETNAYQRALYEAVQENYPRLPVYSWHTANAGPRNPGIGVLSMDKYFEQGRFQIPRGNIASIQAVDQLIAELHFWGVADTSDVAMALWLAFEMLRPHIDRLVALPPAEELGFGKRDKIMGLSGKPLPRVMAQAIQRHAKVGGPLGHLSPIRGNDSVMTPKKIMEHIAKKSKGKKEKPHDDTKNW